MPAPQPEVNPTQSYCPQCGLYIARTDSDEIKELKGLLEIRSAQLEDRDNTILKLQRDLQQAEADKAEQERIYKHMERVAKLPEKPSRDAATSGTKNRESLQVLVESTTAAKRLEVQDTSQQSQEGMTMGLTMKKGFFLWKNKGGVIRQQIGEGKRQVDEIVSETTVKLNTKDSGVNSKSRHRDIEQALDRIEQKMDRYHDEAHRGRTEVEANISEWEAWKRTHSSSGANEEKFSMHSGIIQMVEKLNHDIFQFAWCLAESLPSQNRQYRSDPGKGNRDIDPPIQNLLNASRITSHDPSLAVQIAIQAYFVSSCSRTIRSWHPKGYHDEVLKNLYEEFQRRVAPQVADEWRTLTKSCLFQIAMGEEKPVSQTVADMCMYY